VVTTSCDGFLRLPDLAALSRKKKAGADAERRTTRRHRLTTVAPPAPLFPSTTAGSAAL
jgi:hypothetical protein